MCGCLSSFRMKIRAFFRRLCDVHWQKCVFVSVVILTVTTLFSSTPHLRATAWSAELFKITQMVRVPFTASTNPPPSRLRENDSHCYATDFKDSQSRFLRPMFVPTYPKTAGGGKIFNSTFDKQDKNKVRVALPYTNRSADVSELPTAYLITPTYARITQKADLLRLCYTLMHVPRVHWIVVEDSKEKTPLVTEILANCPGPSVTHLAVIDNKKTGHRGLDQRNAALNWIQKCVLPSPQAGGVYFADDDNTYDLLVFEAVRWAQNVSIWPVGIVGGALWEGPVCSNGKVIGWEGQFGQTRKFPVDMASFAMGVNFMLSRPKSRFNLTWHRGQLETEFLASLKITMDQLTPQPDPNCSQVLAWHTQTREPHGFRLPKRARARPAVKTVKIKQ